MSKHNTYSVIFEGKLSEGYDVQKSLQCLRTKLNLSDSTIKKIISSKGNPLLENVAHEIALKLADSLKSCGLMMNVVAYEVPLAMPDISNSEVDLRNNVSFSSLIIKKYGLAFTVYNCVALFVFLYIVDIYTQFRLAIMSEFEVAFISAIFGFPLFIVASSALTVRKIRLSGTALEGSAFKWWASSSGILSRFILYIGIFCVVITYLIGLQDGFDSYFDYLSLFGILIDLPLSFLILYITFHVVKKQSIFWLVPFRTYFLSINVSAAFKTVFIVIVLLLLLFFTSFVDNLLEMPTTDIHSQNSHISIIKWASELIIWKNNLFEWINEHLSTAGLIIYFVEIILSLFCILVICETVYIVYMTNYLSVHDNLNNKLCQDSNANRKHGYIRYIIIFLAIILLNFCILKFISVDTFGSAIVSAGKEKVQEEALKHYETQKEKLPWYKRMVLP